MGYGPTGLTSVGGPEFVWNQAAMDALKQISSAMSDSHGLDEGLACILKVCSEGFKYGYPSIVLFDEHSNRLACRPMSSPPIGEPVSHATPVAGNPLDGLFGSLNQRQYMPLQAAQGDVIPPPFFSFRLDATNNLLVRVYKERRPLVTTHLYDLVRPYSRVREARMAQCSLLIESVVIVPLLAAERCLGAYIVASTASRSLTDASIPIIGLLAMQAATVIENARLREDLSHRERQVDFLLKETIDAQENERERIYMDIHDGVVQTMAAALHYLQTLDVRPGLSDDLRAAVSKASTLMKAAVGDAREVINSLRPAALDALGLAATIRHELDEIRSQAGWELDFEADNVRFPKAVETALYRIVHEAVNNVRKHAQARKVRVRVKSEQGRIVVEVEDDGVGFNPRVFEQQLWGKSIGLLSIRKRTELMEGSFQVVSSPRKGTLVRVEVPLLFHED